MGERAAGPCVEGRTVLRTSLGCRALALHPDQAKAGAPDGAFERELDRPSGREHTDLGQVHGASVRWPAERAPAFAWPRCRANALTPATCAGLRNLRHMACRRHTETRSDLGLGSLCADRRSRSVRTRSWPRRRPIDAHDTGVPPHHRRDARPPGPRRFPDRDHRGGSVRIQIP